MVYTEKMASIGILAAGIAHEINNPMSYVISNLSTLSRYTDDLMSIVKVYESISETLSKEELRRDVAEITGLKQQKSLAFLQEDIPELLKDINDGTERVKEIVMSLKEFSHTSQAEAPRPTDIKECIDAAIKMVRNELKYHCEVKLNIGETPLVECSPSKIQQVLINILVNAGQAITTGGLIEITTSSDDTQVAIAIRDNGKGIARENLDKLFDPFFTTKNVGEGTGLGLAISYGIIQEHNGSISVDTKLGEGACFTLRLPISR